MIAGIIAGSISAIVAALVSLPLRSPDDALLNSASTALAAMAAGLAAGVLHRVLANNRNGLLIFSGLWTTAFVIVAVISLVGETQFDHFLAFVLPLAAIVFPLTGLLTVLMERSPLAGRWWLALGTAVIAIAVGISLAGQGDQESGKLKLPPRTGISTPSRTPDLATLSIPKIVGFS
jgi:hypothetical protein